MRMPRSLGLVFLCAAMILPGAASRSEDVVASTLIALLIAEAGNGAPLPESCRDNASLTGSHGTLSGDLGFYLGELQAGGGRVTGACEAIEAGEKQCSVVIGQQLGELEWTRYYRFRMDNAGALASGSLECFTLP
ncbi:MAG: hypothetical protein AAF334_07645 [Pseudomonadota bacterium]